MADAIEKKIRAAVEALMAEQNPGVEYIYDIHIEADLFETDVTIRIVDKNAKDLPVWVDKNGNPLKRGKGVLLRTDGHSMNKKPNHRSYLVECVDTGVIYASCREAAKANDISDRSVRDVLHGRRQTAKGLTFRKVGEV